MRTRPLTFGHQYSCLSEDLTDRTETSSAGRIGTTPQFRRAYWVRIVNLPDGYGAREGNSRRAVRNDSSPIAVELDRRVEAGAIRAAGASPPPFARAFPA